MKAVFLFIGLLLALVLLGIARAPGEIARTVSSLWRQLSRTFAKSYPAQS